MIRVLEVVYRFDYGGIRAFIMNYLNFLDKEKFSVDIYAFGCDSSPFVKQVEDLGARIFFQPENNVRDIPKFVNQIREFIRENGPYDVVHANTNLISAWVLLAAKLENVPVRLSHSHTTGNFGDTLAQKAYSYLRRFLVRTLATRQLACGQMAGESMYGTGANFDIVSNGISLEKFMCRNEQRIAELRIALQIPENAKVYANVTRMDTNKNHSFLVDVFREIHIKDPNAILLYGGVIPDIDPSVDEVKSKVSEYGLSNACRFVDAMMNIEDLYHLSDVWIYCSKFEGLPFGPIELQAASVPVLASDSISKEIDLGLGLVTFKSLNDKVEDWATVAMNLEKIDLSNEQIITAFRNYNYDIKQSVSKLEAFYSGK